MSDPRQPERPAAPVGDKRRHFCQALIGGMAVTSVGTISFPIVTFLGLPKPLGRQEPVKVALADLAEGSTIWADHAGRQIVILRAHDEVRVFDGACPHLGCVIHWDGTSQTFKCPCHGAAFDAAGKPLSGPVNEPLRQVEYTLADGFIIVV